MKCQNCNKEVLAEWEICPFCNYEPVKCNKCDSGWLPKEARFCPMCGSPIFTVGDKQKLIIAKEMNDYRVRGITIFDNDNKPIYNKEDESSLGLEVKWARTSDKEPPKLYVGVDCAHCDMDVIGFDGIIEQVAYEDRPWKKIIGLGSFDEKAFLKEHPEYYGANCPRNCEYQEDESIIQAYKGSPKEYYVDVLTNSGKRLCTLPRKTKIEEILPSGLFVISQWIDEDYLAYGISDKFGKVLLPCKYGKHHKMQIGNNPFSEEEETGIFHCGEFHEMDDGSYDPDRCYKDVFNGDYYCQITKDFLVKSKRVCTKDTYCYSLIEIIDRESRIVLHRIKTWSYNLEELCDGWYRLLYNYEAEEFLMLISKNSTINLPIDNSKDNPLDNIGIYDCYSAKGYNNEGYDTTDGKLYNNHPFIGGDRIIIAEGNPNGVKLGVFKNIMIYSYSGQLVKKYNFKESPILIKSPYKYGKAICMKIKGKAISLCYLDMDGDEHPIPYKGGMKIRNYYDVDMFMASENTFVINDRGDGYSSELRNLDGDVLFKKALWIHPFADGLLTYYPDSGNGYGVIDATGNILINNSPQFDHNTFEAVIYSDGKYKQYFQNGDGKYEEL